MSKLILSFWVAWCVTFVAHQAIAFPTLQQIGKVSSEDTWAFFSPPDNSCRVELPTKPVATKRFDAGSEDETRCFRCTKSLLGAYTFSRQQGWSESYFVLGIFDVSGCKRTKSDFTKGTKQLVQVLVADDPNDHILRDQSLKINGYRARIFVVKISTSGYSWQMFVEAKQRIFWLSYFTSHPQGDSSTEAQRIFHSFTLESQ